MRLRYSMAQSARRNAASHFSFEVGLSQCNRNLPFLTLLVSRLIPIHISSRCTNVAFVAACLTADLFQYRNVERGNGSDVVFILDDPHKLAAEYLRRYCRWSLSSRKPEARDNTRGHFLMNVSQSASGGEAWLTHLPHNSIRELRLSDRLKKQAGWHAVSDTEARENLGHPTGASLKERLDFSRHRNTRLRLEREYIPVI